MKNIVQAFLISFLTLSFACTHHHPTLSTDNSNTTPTVEQNNSEVQKSEAKAEELTDKFELFSLEPNPSVNQREEASPEFHDFIVLGKMEIADEPSRKKILDALKKGTRDAQKENRGKAFCFEPRHGIRSINQGHVTDYVICFSCRRFEKYVDNQQEPQGDDILVNDYPKPIFNKFLIKAGIPLAKTN